MKRKKKGETQERKLASVTGLHFIPCSFCDITLLNLKLAAFLLLLSVISRSICFSLKLQWTHQSVSSHSFSSKNLVILPRQDTFTKININLFYNVSKVFKKALTPFGFVFLCAIVYKTINTDIANFANNVKLSKFKNQFLSLA